MKKINNTEVTEIISASVIYNLIDQNDQIFPQRLTFEVELSKNEIVEGLSFEEWIEGILGYKLVIPVSKNIPEIVEPLERFFPDRLSVQIPTKDYIAETIYKILTVLIGENLKSFKYE